MCQTDVNFILLEAQAVNVVEMTLELMPFEHLNCICVYQI